MPQRDIKLYFATVEAAQGAVWTAPYAAVAQCITVYSNKKKLTNKTKWEAMHRRDATDSRGWEIDEARQKERKTKL